MKKKKIYAIIHVKWLIFGEFMNCIEKMYKEIEEILLKEKQEAAKLAVPVREIRHGFSADASFLTEEVKFTKVDYLSQITLDSEWDKKPLANDRVKEFILFVFKKYFCFNKVSSGEDGFIKIVESSLSGDGDLIQIFTNLTNDLIEYVGEETEAIKTFFTNPYNALFVGDDGYYAVIKKGKYSDVKRPFGFNPNQIKKIIKETFDEYALDFKGKFRSDKEYNTFINGFKAEVNKSTAQPLELEAFCLEKFISTMKANGVSENLITSYVEEKGLSLVKQGNYYYRKNAYDEYANYKKIEFRY